MVVSSMGDRLESELFDVKDLVRWNFGGCNDEFHSYGVVQYMYLKPDVRVHYSSGYDTERDFCNFRYKENV